MLESIFEKVYYSKYREAVSLEQIGRSILPNIERFSTNKSKIQDYTVVDEAGNVINVGSAEELLALVAEEGYLPLEMYKKLELVMRNKGREKGLKAFIDSRGYRTVLGDLARGIVKQQDLVQVDPHLKQHTSNEQLFQQTAQHLGV